jgi:hypothetical protein
MAWWQSNMALALTWGGGLVLGVLLSRWGVYGKKSKAAFSRITNKDLGVMFLVTVVVLMIIKPHQDRTLTKEEELMIQQTVENLMNPNK